MKIMRYICYIAAAVFYLCLSFSDECQINLKLFLKNKNNEKFMKTIGNGDKL